MRLYVRVVGWRNSAACAARIASPGPGVLKVSGVENEFPDRIRVAMESVGIERRCFHILLADSSTTRVVVQYLQRALPNSAVITIEQHGTLAANKTKRESLILCGPYDEMCLQYQRLSLRGKCNSFRPPFTTAILTPAAGGRMDLATCYLVDDHGSAISKMTIAEFIAGYHSTIIVS